MLPEDLRLADIDKINEADFIGDMNDALDWLEDFTHPLPYNYEFLNFVQIHAHTLRELRDEKGQRVLLPDDMVEWKNNFWKRLADEYQCWKKLYDVNYQIFSYFVVVVNKVGFIGTLQTSLKPNDPQKLPKNIKREDIDNINNCKKLARYYLIKKCGIPQYLVRKAEDNIFVEWQDSLISKFYSLKGDSFSFLVVSLQITSILRYLVKEDQIKVFRNPSLFSVDDFKDSTKLVGKLRDAWKTSDAVSLYLKGKLPQPIQQKIDNYKDGEAILQEFLDTLAKAFNELLKIPLYDNKVFTNVVFSKETKAFLAKNILEDELTRLNRLLVEDAYPQEIAKRSKNRKLKAEDILLPYDVLTTGSFNFDQIPNEGNWEKKKYVSVATRAVEDIPLKISAASGVNKIFNEVKQQKFFSKVVLPFDSQFENCHALDRDIKLVPVNSIDQLIEEITGQIIVSPIIIEDVYKAIYMGCLSNPLFKKVSKQIVNHNLKTNPRYKDIKAHVLETELDSKTESKEILSFSENGYTFLTLGEKEIKKVARGDKIFLSIFYPGVWNWLKLSTSILLALFSINILICILNLLATPSLGGKPWNKIFIEPNKDFFIFGIALFGSFLLLPAISGLDLCKKIGWLNRLYRIAICYDYHRYIWASRIIPAFLESLPFLGIWAILAKFLVLTFFQMLLCVMALCLVIISVFLDIRTKVIGEPFRFYKLSLLFALFLLSFTSFFWNASLIEISSLFCLILLLYHLLSLFYSTRLGYTILVMYLFLIPVILSLPTFGGDTLIKPTEVEEFRPIKEKDKKNEEKEVVVAEFETPVSCRKNEIIMILNSVPDVEFHLCGHPTHAEVMFKEPIEEEFMIILIGSLISHKWDGTEPRYADAYYEWQGFKNKFVGERNEPSTPHEKIEIYGIGNHEHKNKNIITRVRYYSLLQNALVLEANEDKYQLKGFKIKIPDRLNKEYWGFLRVYVLKMNKNNIGGKQTVEFCGSSFDKPDDNIPLGDSIPLEGDSKKYTGEFLLPVGFKRLPDITSRGIQFSARKEVILQISGFITFSGFYRGSRYSLNGLGGGQDPFWRFNHTTSRIPDSKQHYRIDKKKSLILDFRLVLYDSKGKEIPYELIKIINPIRLLDSQYSATHTYNIKFRTPDDGKVSFFVNDKVELWKGFLKESTEDNAGAFCISVISEN
ncbi:MAG: hypothetical protein AB1390_09865 [Nitrospirota bacterium]